MLKAALLAALLALSGCSASPLSLLTGGGPNVAANGNIGKTATQTIGTTEIRETRQNGPEIRVKTAETVRTETRQSTDENRVRVERVETLIQQEGPDPWWVVALIVAALLDSPLRWPGQIWRAFSRKKKA